MKMVTAVIRTTALNRILSSLDKVGIKGITISEVKGTGDQVRVGGPYEIHNRLDIIVEDEKADAVSSLIADAAHTGLPGDGVIAVVPLEYMREIRTGERIPGE